ncbi:nuclear transport factor 2 family protein [Neorhizobium alkalisoli]|uniref:Ketosteroid isomerase-like protein n=1 Tax=Neorhizobium alkalisoli TaxID=528178 RepID=A0A561QHI9_9HYPH|nr:nuclear transport factor 2 family protein [Neorhizobium alkalisoli]TWF49802.1 ketosteroid isomerase-like protein [Neorhizobium alkalisoli]
MIGNDVLIAFYDTRANLDLDAHLSFAAQDCVFRMVGTPKLGALTQTWSGLGEIHGIARELFEAWDMSQLEIVSIDRCGETAYVHRKGSVIYRPDGSALDTELIDKLTFRDGAVVEYLQFVDTFAIADFISEKRATAMV